MDKIVLTESALQNIARLKIEMNCQNHALRFGISGGGCSGYKYVIEFEEKSKDNDAYIGDWYIHNDKSKYLIDRKNFKSFLEEFNKKD